MKVTLIGTGNVAFHLAAAISKSSCPLVEIIGRNAAEGKAIAELTGSRFRPLGSDFSATDLILVAVSDDSVEEIMNRLPGEVPAAHTAGAVSLINRMTGTSGVFYPLQTFSKTSAVDWDGIPVLTESHDDVLLASLRDLAEALGARPRQTNTEERLRLHCAAVLVNNMTNHLYAAAEELLEKKNLPFALLHPLMRETVAKAMRMSPTDAQTGPAKRGDAQTVNRHLQLLAEHPETAVLYAILSKHITRKHNG